MEIRLTGTERTYIVNCINPLRSDSPPAIQETAENINECIKDFMKKGWFGTFIATLRRSNQLERKYRADPSYKWPKD